MRKHRRGLGLLSIFGISLVINTYLTTTVLTGNYRPAAQITCVALNFVTIVLFAGALNLAIKKMFS